MGIHQISFAKVSVLSNDMAEITVDSGADITLDMVNELHHLLLSLL